MTPAERWAKDALVLTLLLSVLIAMGSLVRVAFTAFK
jgi:hypothetical protein